MDGTTVTILGTSAAVILISGALILYGPSAFGKRASAGGASPAGLADGGGSDGSLCDGGGGD